MVSFSNSCSKNRQGENPCPAQVTYVTYVINSCFLTSLDISSEAPCMQLIPTLAIFGHFSYPHQPEATFIFARRLYLLFCYVFIQPLAKSVFTRQGSFLRTTCTEIYELFFAPSTSGGGKPTAPRTASGAGAEIYFITATSRFTRLLFICYFLSACRWVFLGAVYCTGGGRVEDFVEEELRRKHFTVGLLIFLNYFFIL